MNCYVLRNIFYEKVAKGDLVIKNGKRADQRMHKPEVAMTFIGCEDLMEEEVKNIASSSAAPMPLQDEEMTLTILQNDKFHAFLEGMGLRPLARREATLALTQVVEMSWGTTTSEGSVLQVAYQEIKELVTFSARDLANRAVDGERPLYVTAFLGASQIKRALVDTGASTNILPLLTLDALDIPRERIIREPFQVARIGLLQ